MTELPDELRTLGRGLTVEARADLAERVLERIAVPRPTRRWRRWLAGLLAVVAAFALTAALAAPVRAAIVHAFRFGGVEVRQEPGPTPRSSPVLPGEHASDLAAAGAEVGFPVRVPAALGPPGQVTVAEHRVVSVRWLRPDGPVQLDVFAGNLGVYWEKYVAGGVGQPVTVNGYSGLWFEDPVTIVYVDANDNELPGSARSSDGTLLWYDGTLTYRLDGIRPRDAALAVAATLG